MNHPYQLKRPIPTNDVLLERAALVRTMRNLPPSQPQGLSPIGLSYGNTKTGRTGSKFRTVFVWNIPAVATCPGASETCLQYCYNADERKGLFPVEAWNENLAWYRNQPNMLMRQINSQLIQAEGCCAVRIHSSGDFFSGDYVEFWREIATVNLATSFWAYTRSWRIPELFEKLERFRKLPNVEIFASWDATMPSPPIQWRLSVVADDHLKPSNEELWGQRLFFCPEQIGRVANCASCGFCMKHDLKGVLFTLH